jgi:Zn-dependent protease with chaperone function
MAGQQPNAVGQGIVDTEVCPRCGSKVPPSPGYASWCNCGWNLVAPEAEVPAGSLGRLYASLGRRLGEQLASDLVDADTLEPHLTPSRFAAYLVALGVHVLTVVLVVGGAVLVTVNFPNVFMIVVGVICIAAGVFMRPRLGKVPTENVVDPEQAPALVALVDRIAAALETPTADAIVIDRDFNASWAVLGVRRSRVLRLGLPLLSALEPDERVALIAHEFAHARNGDASRSLVVGSAVRSLQELYHLLAPQGGTVMGEIVIVARIGNSFLWLISRPVLGLLYLEYHLLLRDKQRAEYLADALAAQVAGTSATVRLQEKLLLDSTAGGVVHSRIYDLNSEADLFEQITRAVTNVPERERERRRRVARLEESRLDVTHPPTGHRIRLLEERPALPPVVHTDEAEAAKVDANLARYRKRFQAELIDERRARLYNRYG